MNNDDAPLSERLEQVARIHEKRDFIVAAVCREAAELARRVEGAEVHSSETKDAVEALWNAGYFHGQRVRIVVEE